ncbi:histidine phosphatase family protein [Mucilaginibacter antarcticus]|uniref:Histidine phosphatase family protein n=1 Tax=Mucilaginibacter antarcticus TaxID=1855725 RepID=A0ABW5XMV9_9SPHI
MKNIKIFLIAALLLAGTRTFAQTTTIWLVRHAEKAIPASTATMTASDPELSAEGKKRAEALAKELKDHKIAAVFVTPFKRTTQTGEPTQKQFSLPASKNYDAAKLQAFTKNVLWEYAGKNVLIVGHSNTVIPTLEAFGGTVAFTALSDDDYDMLFKITVSQGSLVSTGVRYYGDKHHTTQIK